MSIVVPPNDLAPSLPSRIVTVKVTDLHEGGVLPPKTPGSVTFTLPGDLRVPGDDIIVRAGSITLELDSDGEGRVRLPVHNAAAQGDGVGGDWYILVSKSWTEQVDMIRVPAGTGNISLADINPVVEVTPAMGQWLITNAAAEVVEGAQWGITVTTTGGVARFRFTVPPGGVAWFRGILDAGANINDLWRSADSGTYRLILSRGYEGDFPAGAPSAGSAILKVDSDNQAGTQELTFYGRSEIWRRNVNNVNLNPRGWTAWKRVDVDYAEFVSVKSRADTAFYRHPVTLPDGSNLNGLTTSSVTGMHILGSTQQYLNLPPRPGNTVGALFIFATSSGDCWQRVVWRFNGGVYERFQTGTGTFTEWRRVDTEAAGGVDPGLEARVRLLEAAVPLQSVFTASGRISTLGEQRAFLTRLDRSFDSVTVATIGETSRGTAMQSVTVGDPALPALVVMCAQHGDEIAGSEAVLPWLQTIAAAPPTEICVVVLPAVNVDSFTIRRLTPSVTDLNRNWTTRTTAEVQAVTGVLAAHDVLAVLDCHEGGSWTDCQILGPTAPGVEAPVMAAASSLHDAVWAGLEAANLPVDVYPGVDDTDVARNALALTEKIPTLVIETPSQLGGTEWEGPEPNPRLYHPSLSNRVAMYRAVFDAALGWAESQP